MTRTLRTVALALALAATPACASLPRFDNPFAAAQSLDQRAYALASTYAALLEEAADIVRDPAVPLSVKRALGQAERVATPAVQAVEAALGAYAQAQGDARAAEAQRLSAAVAEAERPVSEMQRLVGGQR